MSILWEVENMALSFQWLLTQSCATAPPAIRQVAPVTLEREGNGSQAVIVNSERKVDTVMQKNLSAAVITTICLNMNQKVHITKLHS